MTLLTEIHTVGRMAPDSRSAIQIPPGVAGQESISHDHLEIMVTPDERYYIRDLESANGTFVLEDGAWTRIQPAAEVSSDTPLRLGDFQTTVGELLAGHLASASPHPDEHRQPHGCCMIRCVCGAMKPRGKTCRHCGA